MPGTEALRHQKLDGLPEQLRTPIAKDSLCLRVHQDDSSSLVDDNDCVRCGFQQPSELLLGLLAYRSVPDGAHHHSALFGLQGIQTDLNRELGAVASQPV